MRAAGLAQHFAPGLQRRAPGAAIPGSSAAFVSVFSRNSPVKLVPFSAQFLRLDEPLPFGLRDADGRLLLHAGLRIADPTQMQALSGVPLFADETESAG